MRNERGFTLIELLIVLAILAILVGVVAMSVGGITDTANDRAMSAELEVVQTAIDTYITLDGTSSSTAAITERASTAAAPIVSTDEAVDAPFYKYLNGDTKYSYYWDAWTGLDDTCTASLSE